MSELTNRIDMILTKNKLRRADLCRGAGIGESTIRKWITGSSPSVDLLYPVAKFLGVSMEYLVTGVEPEKTDKVVLSEKEKRLLELFRHLDERDQFSVLTLTSGLESQYSYTKDARISDA